jgi:hypothetical protein
MLQGGIKNARKKQTAKRAQKPSKLKMQLLVHI